MDPVAILIKNVSGDMLVIPEIGDYNLPDGDEIDIRPYYAQPDAPMRALYALPTADLYQMRQAGDIEVKVLFNRS